MTVLAVFSTAAAAFLLGFLLASRPPRREKPVKRGAPVYGGEETERLSREYSNFLSYDGTEQSQK
ncbi:MAG: hypothetical protein ACI4F7_08725 [Acutalibacteraceae bacterium]